MTDPTGSPTPDPARELREWLVAGRYQDVLDRFPPESIQDAGEEPHIALGVATASTRLGLLDQGERLALGALKGFRRRADDDGRMRCHNLLGAIAYERGKFTTASGAFAEALELSRILGDLQIWARASNNLASVALQQGRLEQAASLYREVILAYQKLGDRRGLAEASHNLGVATRELGQLEAAERLGIDAVQHAGLAGDPALMALALTGQAETAVWVGTHAVATEGLDRAERLAREAGDELGVAEVERVRAERWLRMGEARRAADAAESARAAAAEFGSAELQAESAAISMRAHRKLGDNAKAAERRAEAEALFTSLGGVLHLNRLREAD